MHAGRPKPAPTQLSSMRAVFLPQTACKRIRFYLHSISRFVHRRTPTARSRRQHQSLAAARVNLSLREEKAAGMAMAFRSHGPVAQGARTKIKVYDMLLRRHSHQV